MWPKRCVIGQWLWLYWHNLEGHRLNPVISKVLYRTISFWTYENKEKEAGKFPPQKIWHWINLPLRHKNIAFHGIRSMTWVVFQAKIVFVRRTDHGLECPKKKERKEREVESVQRNFAAWIFFLWRSFSSNSREEKKKTWKAFSNLFDQDELASSDLREVAFLKCHIFWQCEGRGFVTRKSIL